MNDTQEDGACSRNRIRAARHQLLKHFAQHLRIDGYLNVEGRGLHYGEIEPVKQVGQDGLIASSGTVTPSRLSRSVSSTNRH